MTTPPDTPQPPERPPPLISIVAPAYNEASNIQAFYDRVSGVLNKMEADYEIVFVNDGSTDDTLERFLDLAGKDHRVRVVDLSRNFGKEIARSAGIDAARGDAVVPIDVDLQDPPELIPDLVAKWREGYDVVYATRERREGESWFKRLTAVGFYRLMEKLTPIGIPRDTGDFRLMSRPVVEALQQIPERHRFMKGLFAWVGFKQTGVKYSRDPRLAGKTAWNYWKLWNFALEGITSFSHIPLQLVSYFGFGVAVLAFLYSLVIVTRTLIQGGDVPGYPSLITVILFLGGIQLLSIGILGEYIGRIHDEVKRRPLYIVKEKYGFGASKTPPPGNDAQ